jgi:hypothetical protein
MVLSHQHFHANIHNPAVAISGLEEDPDPFLYISSSARDTASPASWGTRAPIGAPRI